MDAPWDLSLRMEAVSACLSGGASPPRVARSGRPVAVRGGCCESSRLNSSNLAKPVDGRRPGALFPVESSTRIDRDRVKRFANRGLFFFDGPDSESVPAFLYPLDWQLFSAAKVPSDMNN